MARMNWDKVRRDNIQRRADNHAKEMDWFLLRAGRTSKRSQRKPSIWPVYVTDGANPNGILRVRTFHNREQADAAGFDWVGR